MSKEKYAHIYQQPDYVADINSVKKMYPTPHLNFYAILVRIPNIGRKLALKVADAFHSVSGFFDELKTASESTGVYVPGEQLLRSYNFDGMTETGIRNICSRFDV